MYSTNAVNVCEKNSAHCEKGWAFKVNKPKTTFTEDQKAFLTDKFNVGKKTGRKEDPSKVAEEMRLTKKDGVNRFSRAQFLTTQRVSSYFSRLAQKDKKLMNQTLEQPYWTLTVPS